MGGLAIVVFCDLVDSTALLARLGDDRMERVRRAHVEDVTGAVVAAGGRVVKTLGDGAMASFESGLGALRAAAGIQASVERLDATHGGLGLAARVGVAAGEPISHDDDLHGMAVVIASRLCSAAARGEVLVQDLVHALVASREGVVLDEARGYELKGVPTPVWASRLRWRELEAEARGERVLESAAASAAAATIGDRASSGRFTPALANGESAPAKGSTHAPGNGARPRDGVPLPRVLAAYEAEPLIGRDREIGMLRDATAPREGCRAVLVLGEPGIGKTRHAAAAAADAHARGEVVVLARCPPEAVIPFEPWVRAIGELARAGDESWREALARAAGAELSGLVPELGVHTTAAPERASAGEVVAAEGARYRLLRGIGTALAHGAGEAPLHVVLDDAHWCDAASAQALGHMLDGAPAAQLVLTVTARERELGRGHPVSRVLADLRRTGDLSELRLTGLDAGGMAALVAARVGRAITPRLAARLQTRTAGNPFFAAELARDLDERDALRDGEALEAAPVPDAVTDLVEERLARLDPVTERLLVAVAAIGPSAPVTLAARAAGIGDEDAERAVSQALSERLVDDVPAALPTIMFPHALIREALTAGANDAARARLHLAVASALEEEDPDAEPAELARHYGLAVAVAGPEPAIAAYRAAAVAAAEGHDHEQAAAHMRGALGLLGESDLTARASVLLELGEQELLAADLIRARQAFREAGDAARTIGDAGTLARAALGFAGGDIAFGWETGNDDTATVVLLREGLDALGDTEPRLALRMIYRLVYALTYTDDHDVLDALARHAEELDRHLGDTESRVIARSTRLIAVCTFGSSPLAVLDQYEEILELADLAEGCGREDLLFRGIHWLSVAYYALGRIAECERAIERAAEIAQRLGSPRFTWEVDVSRGHRLLDHGDREGSEALIRRAGATVRRLRPDIHITVELMTLLSTIWIYDGETATARPVYAAMQAVGPSGIMSAVLAWAAAIDGDHDTARHGLARLLDGDDLAPLRRPDIQLPTALCFLALAATLAGDRAAGERLRPLLEPLRPYLMQAAPALFFGNIAEWHIGRLELLADRPEAAVEELCAAVARADALDLVWLTAWARVDLAIALHRRDGPGDAEQARATLAEGEAIAERYAMRWVIDRAALACAELDGRELPTPTPPTTERSRPIRALTARSGRRALSARVRGLDDETLERRFAEPGRQRALLRAMARGFQPAHARGFSGLIAYELEPFAIEPPPDAPWRWAIEVDLRTGRARLLEPAPLEAAVTIHFGLAEWVRVTAGVQDAITAMVAGRCSVEGDVLVAVRLEGMFGGQ
jgi:class 3 adenylate cyclase/tetratricopeptide (TPR) repeat protein